MSNPRGPLLPEIPGQHKTIFILPKDTFATVLVTSEKQLRSAEEKNFRDANAAFAWCRANRACLVYFPPAPTRKS